MRTFTLNGWASSVIAENDDGSADLNLTSPEGDVEVLHIAGAADAEVTLDAPSASAPRPSAMAIQASSPEPKE